MFSRYGRRIILNREKQIICYRYKTYNNINNTNLRNKLRSVKCRKFGVISHIPGKHALVTQWIDTVVILIIMYTFVASSVCVKNFEIL